MPETTPRPGVAMNKRKIDKSYLDHFRDDIGIVGDLVHDLELADKEVERVRLMNRCERHGGHDPESHCYPCHTENLIKAEAEIERLREVNSLLYQSLDHLTHAMINRKWDDVDDYVGMAQSARRKHEEVQAALEESSP